MTTRIRIQKAMVKKIALGDGAVEITLKAMADDVLADRDDLDAASSPTFLANVAIDGERQQLELEH
jgi:hypothetical protein